MRMLVDEDDVSYSHFKHVQVVFLPPCSERDIKELEGRLQVQPDIRADYSWTSEAMLYRDLRNEEWDDTEIADLYKKKITEIRELITMLEDSEYYLESRKKMGMYSIVQKNEYAFRQLQKARKKCGEDESKKTALTKLVFELLDEPESAGERLYESIPDLLKYLDDVVEALAQQIKINNSVQNQNEDDLDLLGKKDVSKFEIIPTLVEKAHGSQIREIIKDKIQQKRFEDQEKKDASYSLRQIQIAYSKLDSADSSLDANSELSGILDLLKNIERVVDSIRDFVTDANNSD